MRCGVCFRHCDLAEKKTGVCGVRTLREGKIVPLSYGRITSMALDPIEKKPLYHFMPGSMILSIGSFGCNLRCPFCQNFEISWSDEALSGHGARQTTSQEIATAASRLRERGNIGVAYTYNEPLVAYEFVRDTAKLVHEAGMRNVMVTNGTATPEVLDELLPYIDAMNIDLKCFDARLYRKLMGGDLEMVQEFITRAVRKCHVEITNLIITGENDTDEAMDLLASWVAGLRDEAGNVIGKGIPLHVTRFFPKFRMIDRKATPVETVYHLAEVARKHLDHVYTGNC